MSASVARVFTRRMYSIYSPSIYFHSFLSRFPCVGSQICPLAIQYARHESYHDGGWNCFMEKEGGRNILRRGRLARDRMLFSSCIFSLLTYAMP